METLNLKLEEIFLLTDFYLILFHNFLTDNVKTLSSVTFSSSKYLLTITRLRMVKNTNLFWDSKKLFLTFWKTVFWVTEHFCIKWTFWKNVIFCPKNAFFWQKWQFDPLLRAAPRQCQGTFFSGGNFTPIFEAKKVGTSGQKCPGHFDSSQFSPKSAIFGGFEKKSFQKWL